jgi:hypothetical protein
MEPDERMHLYRGAPGVRNWSRYKATERSWALCGRRNSGRQLLATEDASLVTCPFCCDLMQSKSYDRPAKQSARPEEMPRAARLGAQV